MSSDNPGVTAPPDDRRRPAEHYENFPVASWLCPPRLRPPIAAIYWYARTADDIADEGSATAAERLAELAAYRMDLVACLGGNTASERWPGVFQSLARAVRDFQLPPEPLLHLLDAFVQDVEKTRDGAGYPDRAALLAYCRLSANPIGRLLLHLYGVHDATALVQSDAICSALQLINFWQDLSVDLPRGRYYLPEQDCRDLGVDCRNPGSALQGAALVGELCEWSRVLMLSGAPLVHRVPGR
ncbi:MAG: squalene synthase HpnC, partial [Ramlibacter sp.]|nr:squalene synthase HpnC [Ramlibacter sp.]